MLALLRNSRNKDLETVVAHAQPSYSHPVANLPDNVNFASDNSFSGFSSGPSSFFERLFGGPSFAPAPIGHRPPRQIITR